RVLLDRASGLSHGTTLDASVDRPGYRLPGHGVCGSLPAVMRGPLRLDSEMDPSELRFRLDSVPAGAWVTFVICFAGLGYVLGWDHDNEGALSACFALGAVGGAVVLALPWERIVRSRWREVVFCAWSVLDLGLIIVISALDGGGDSVFVAVLVVP